LQAHALSSRDGKIHINIWKKKHCPSYNMTCTAASAYAELFFSLLHGGRAIR
jgi:hypothetical protein